MSDVSHSALLAQQADTIPVAQVLPELVKRGFTRGRITSGMLYRAIASGAVPAERSATNRLTVQRSDLPAIAQALGLPLASAPVQAAA